MRDPLAAKIKWKLNKSHGISPEAVTAVYSSEKPLCNLLPLTEEQREAPQDYGAVEYLRLRVMPVLGTSPALFGQTMAAYAACELAGRPFAPDACDAMSKNLRQKMMAALRKNELQRFGDKTALDIDDDELEFVVHQVWRGRCAVTDRRIGGNTALVLTRWVADQSPTVYNLVLVAPHIAEALSSPRGAEGVITVEQSEVIRSRLAWARQQYDVL